jgi:hypothetical protein
MKNFLFIMILVLGCFLTSCRANFESKVSQSRQYADEIGVVLRRVDSLSSTISERQHIKVEFYPLSEYSGRPIPTTDTAAKIGPSRRNGHRENGGGVGAVKSIEITTETETSTHSNALTDSTSVSKTAKAENLQKEKAQETRQDNGTVFIVAVAAAFVLLAALLIIIKKIFHK